MQFSQIAWLVGMVTFVCSALVGQAELLGEPWRHYVTVTAIMGGTLSAYMLQHPWDEQNRRRRRARKPRHVAHDSA